MYFSALFCEGRGVAVGQYVIVEADMPAEFEDMLSISVNAPRDESSYWSVNENMGKCLFVTLRPFMMHKVYIFCILHDRS